MPEPPAGVSPVPRAARPYQGRQAGLVTRTLAGCIDGLVVVALILLGFAGWTAVRFVLDPRGFQLSGGGAMFGATSWLLLMVVYLTAAWSVTGRTYGGHLMGLRVVDHRGRHPHLLLASLRALLCTFFPIGLLWCVANRAQRSVQDLLVRTQVIYDWLPEAEHDGTGAAVTPGG